MQVSRKKMGKAEVVGDAADMATGLLTYSLSTISCQSVHVKTTDAQAVLHLLDA